jgi:hypothetical protein
VIIARRNPSSDADDRRNDRRRPRSGSFDAQSAIVAQKIFRSGLCGIQPCFAIRWHEDPMRAESRTPRGMS